MTTFPHLTYANNLIVSAAPWDQAYWKAVALVRELPGTVVCPEDPTIPLYAKQYAGQNFFSEKDAHPRMELAGRDRTVLAELRRADYVVDVINYWGENSTKSFSKTSASCRPRTWWLIPRCYRIWQRKTSRVFEDEKGGRTWNVAERVTGSIPTATKSFSRSVPSKSGGPVDQVRESSVDSDPSAESSEIVILIPVFNDWDSLAQLLPRLDQVLAAHGLEADVLVVDDGSTSEPDDIVGAVAFAALAGSMCCA